MLGYSDIEVIGGILHMIELTLCEPCGELLDNMQDMASQFGEDLTLNNIKDLCPDCKDNIREMVEGAST